MMQIVGSFAEFERAMLRERTKNGLQRHARMVGLVRRPKLTPQQQKEIVSLVTSGQKQALMQHVSSGFTLPPCCGFLPDTGWLR